MTIGGETPQPSTEAQSAQVNTPGPNFPCPYCEKRSRVRTSSKVSRTLRVLYYQCSNVLCGHTWQSHLSFVGTISPTALTVPASRLLPMAAKNLVPTVCETRAPASPPDA